MFISNWESPIILFLCSRSSSPHRLDMQPANDAVNTLHLAASFLHWTSTEMAASTKNITHASPSRLHLDGSAPFPVNSAKPTSLVTSMAAVDVPADAHVRWASLIALATLDHPRPPSTTRGSPATRTAIRRRRI